MAEGIVMRVFLKCIYENNLGDDLFISIVCDRYPGTQFTLLAQNDLSLSPKIANLEIFRIHPLVYRVLRKISYQFSRICMVDRYLVSKSDIVCAIGGSLFMESKKHKDTIRSAKHYNTYWFDQVKKPLYIIGSNIGPVYNDHYIEKVRNVFAKTKDVCLRDAQSKAYADNEHVRVAPDVIFGVIDDQVTEHSGKTAIISVISCAQKAKQMKQFDTEKYRNAMASMIRSLINDSYHVILYSFCKAEGDEDEINVLKNITGDNDHLSEYFYRGNIPDALNVMRKADVVIGTRFHANVIGFAMHKKVIPVIYNDKTRNLLNDLHFAGKAIDIENDIYPSYDELMANQPLDDSLIKQLKKESGRQFEGLDRILR